MPGGARALCAAGRALWLTVHRNPHDPRITPATRGDIAAKHLEGKVDADRFVEGALREVVAPQAPLRGEPRPDALLDTEALKGERVMVYDSTEEGWSWGQLLDDDYVGWLPTRRPGHCRRGADPHRLGGAHAGVPGPVIKLTPIEALSFGCQLPIARIEPQFAVTADNGFVPLRHLGDRSTARRDFVAVAERFVGTPYLWGGKTSLGLDCSALVQLALRSLRHRLARATATCRSRFGRRSNRPPISLICSAAT